MNPPAETELDNQAEARVFLALGSNLASRHHNLLNALERLSACSIEVQSVSSIYQTEPVGPAGQPAYLNLACEVGHRFSPRQLLIQLKRIEVEMGRRPTPTVEPRTIDIDLLFYGPLMQSSNDLTLPHPHLHERRFFLVPLVEIAPHFVDPVTQLKLTEVLASCPDRSQVEVFSSVTRRRFG